MQSNAKGRHGLRRNAFLEMRTKPSHTRPQAARIARPIRAIPSGIFAGAIEE